MNIQIDDIHFINLQSLVLRHNLDVMHIKKNVCDSIIGTMLNDKAKSKDGLKSRKDLKVMKIRSALHPQKRRNGHFLPAAPYTLSKVEKKLFCQRIADLKLPDGYGSNIAKCVDIKECKIMGLKSHDCHMLIQQIMPVALRGLLPKGPRIAIFRLCVFFKEICKTTIDRNQVEKLEEEVVETLCMLERFFPPSFFDIMVHLVIHIGREVRLCGLVIYRWQYPVERYIYSIADI